MDGHCVFAMSRGSNWVAKTTPLIPDLMVRRSASIGIYQLPGANAITTAELVRNKMQEMSSSNNWPKGLEYKIPFDTHVVC